MRGKADLLAPHPNPLPHHVRLGIQVDTGEREHEISTAYVSEARTLWLQALMRNAKALGEDLRVRGVN